MVTAAVVEPGVVEPAGVMVIAPLKGLVNGSSVANTVGSIDIKIFVTEPERATPLVVRLGGKPLWLTRSQTAVLLDPLLAAVTVNGITSPLEVTSTSRGAGIPAPVTNVYANASEPTPTDEEDVTLSVGAVFATVMVTNTTAGLPLGTAVSIVMVPEWLPGSSVVAFTVTISDSGDRPVDGVTESQPCGFDAATACMVWPLIEAGSVTMKGFLSLVTGGVALFAVYVKVKEVTLAVGPVWAATGQQ